jgi:hypothetical protein
VLPVSPPKKPYKATAIIAKPKHEPGFSKQPSNERTCTVEVVVMVVTDMTVAATTHFCCFQGVGKGIAFEVRWSP